MLNKTEFWRYTNITHQFCEPAKEYIGDTRSSEASRMVGTRAVNNVCSFIVSKKMNHTISTESRSAERSFLLLSEYDSRTLEIWDQPEPIKVQRTDKNGKKRSGSYTPDFLVLTETGAIIVEAKTSDEVEKQLKKKPEDWKRCPDGRSVEYLPAKEAFSKIGLRHSVYIYDPSDRYRIANLELMMRSRGADELCPIVEEKIFHKFNKSFAWNMHDLKRDLGLSSYQPIIQLVDENKLFFKIDRELLSDPKSCILVMSKTLLDAAHELFGVEKIYCDEMLGELSVSRFPSAKTANDALKRLERVEGGESSRNVRRWREKIRKGKELGLTPFQSLVSQKYLSGNRESRISSRVIEFVMKYIYDIHAVSAGLSDYRSYFKYKDLAILEHPKLDPVSRNTFNHRLKLIPENIIAAKRGGKRARNAKSEPSNPIKRSLKPQLAWQSAAVDHYLADIYLIYFSSRGVANVMRPWVSAMIDLSSSAVLAVTISFKSPSRASDAKLIRECVRKHGKLPNEIIVDRGSDFTSKYFASLMAHYGVDYVLRPAGHSRFGGEVEGFFGEFKKQWLSQRAGNLADYEEVRAVDGEFSPEKNAVLRPYDFYREINEFCNWRDNKSRGNCTKSSAFKVDEDQSGFPFLGIEINYDNDFMLATAVESREYKVDLQRGIHLNGMWYWHPDVAKSRGKKSKLEVRLDPENPHVVYALVDNNWVTCGSSKLNAFSSKDKISQFVEGLELIESIPEKRLVKEEADLDLARVIREMDSVSESDHGVPFIAFERGDNKTPPSVFEQIKESQVKSLTIESWG